MISHDNKDDVQADIEKMQKIPIINSIFDVICRTTGMGFATIARVTDTKWTACAVRDDIAFGLVPGGELSLETTICNEIRQHHQPVVIDNVAEHKIFSTHHTPAMYGFQSYISIPIIRKDGTFFGTLCAIDPKPAKLDDPETISLFELFAELISFHLNTFDELAASEQKLKEEKRTAELREQFIAILGHDLKNPVGAIRMGAELLSMAELDNELRPIISVLQNSAYRMSGLIDNILDFAKGRLGEGIILDKKSSPALAKTLDGIVHELLTIYPDHVIYTDINLPVTVSCDENRVGQLFSNLLANAIIHGDGKEPIKVTAWSNEKEFVLTVSNYGAQIPEKTVSALFLPFQRGENNTVKEGLGLGLFIASEIAKAHKGTLTVDSGDAETTFTLRIAAS